MGFVGTLATRYAGVRVDTIAKLDPEKAGRRAVVALSFPAPPGASGDRPVVLVLGGQHGDERAGVEAALMLARDLAVGRGAELLRILDIRIVPIVNPWGLDNASRRNEDGMDLNRDHMRQRSDAVRGIHAAFAGQVAAMLDLHELGPVMYDVEIGAPTHPNVDPGLVEFARFYLTPYVARQLGTLGLTYHEYLVQEPPLEGQEEGIAPPPDSAVYVTYAPIAAHNARNAFALGGAVALLVEVSSTRAIDGYEARSQAMRAALGAFLEVLAMQTGELRARVEAARAQGPATVVLRARNAVDPARPRLTLRMRSEYGTAVNGVLDDWRPLVEPTALISRPTAYVLPETETALAALLVRNGLLVEHVLEPITLPIAGYAEPPADAADSLPVRVDGTLARRVETIPENSFLVRTDQPGARLLSTLIEPWSQDGWYADAILDDADYVPTVWRLEGDLPAIAAVPVDSDPR